MVPWRRGVVVTVRSRSVVIPAVIVNIDQVRVPFEAAGVPAPGVIIGADPYAGTISESWVAPGIGIVDDMRIIDRNIYIFLLYGFDDDGLFLDDFHLFIALQMSVV